ncbi:UNVERIFIED_CONTAM: Retrovirus-related Pol polyprotein from transposon RE2 [Sesamum calycinum]|uniref:Retrovirus-related Pol polyprotein from transposon RE2 n=1 Tax=Sesamum calycinum TaxID=2727403 RepID=A0AAW2RUH3_9LAMI
METQSDVSMANFSNRRFPQELESSQCVENSGFTLISSSLTGDNYLEIVDAFIYATSAKETLVGSRGKVIAREDSWQLMRFFMGLNSTYDHCGKTIVGTDATLCVSVAVYQVQHRDLKYKLAMDKRATFCDYCKKSGHLKENCFKLHGTHEWYKDLSEKKRKGTRRGRGFIAAVEALSLNAFPQLQSSNFSSTVRSEIRKVMVENTPPQLQQNTHLMIPAKLHKVNLPDDSRQPVAHIGTDQWTKEKLAIGKLVGHLYMLDKDSFLPRPDSQCSKLAFTSLHSITDSEIHNDSVLWKQPLGHLSVDALKHIPSINVNHLSFPHPFDFLCNHPPLYDHLRILGCLCYATSVNPSKSKFDKRASKCIFFGYPPRHKGYKLFDLESQSYIISRDVLFYEHIFPFSTSSPSSLPPYPLPLGLDLEDAADNIPTSVTAPAPINPNDHSSIPQPLPLSSTPQHHSDSLSYNSSLPDPSSVSASPIQPLRRNLKIINSLYKGRNGSMLCGKRFLLLSKITLGMLLLFLPGNAPLAVVIVRLFLAISSAFAWPLHQLDVNNVFLQGYLDEEIYMLPLEGYFVPTVGPLFRSLMSRLILMVYSPSRIWVWHIFFLGYKLCALLKGVKISRTGGAVLSNPEPYRHLVGRLLYLGFTRPDISYGVQQFSQYLQQPCDSHWEVALHIVRYLKSTPITGLFFPSSNSLQLQAFCNADWASYLDTRRSISGFCVFLGSALISWKTKKQTTVFRSSTEAKYQSMGATVCDLQWIFYLLRDFGLPAHAPIPMYCDNKAALHIMANPVFHEQTKHLDIDCHIVRNQYKFSFIAPSFVHGKEQLADLFTKSLPGPLFLGLLSKLALFSLDSRPACGGCHGIVSSSNPHSHENQLHLDTG